MKLFHRVSQRITEKTSWISPVLCETLCCSVSLCDIALLLFIQNVQYFLFIIHPPLISRFTDAEQAFKENNDFCLTFVSLLSSFVSRFMSLHLYFSTSQYLSVLRFSSLVSLFTFAPASAGQAFHFLRFSSFVSRLSSLVFRLSSFVHSQQFNSESIQQFFPRCSIRFQSPS